MKKIKIGNRAAMVSDLDFGFLNQFTWSLDLRGKTPYAKTNVRDGNGKWTTTTMHKMIAVRMGLSGVRVDHRDRNGLNNQRYNLRGATYQQNRTNTGLMITNKSGHPGVFWEKAARKWRTQITHGGMKEHVGLFISKREAAKAYKTRERQLRGEFAGTTH